LFRMTEKEYTDQVIIPLLRHMGFEEVTYNHGVREFGKDIIFVDYDRFLLRKYYAAQVKMGDISGGNSGQLGDIIDQTLHAFEINFEDLITKQEAAISDYYIITSGRFTGNAKDILLQHKRLKAYSHRVHFYEGHHIDELRAKSYADIRRAFTSLLHELETNSQLSSTFLLIARNRKIPLMQFATTGIANVIFLLGGFPEYSILLKQLENLHGKLQVANAVIGSMLVLDPIKGTDEERTKLQNQLPEISQFIELTNQMLIKSLSERI